MPRAFVVTALLLLTAVGHAAPPSTAPLTLSANGATRYRIVRPDQPSRVDDFAVQTLADTLKQTTGAEFAVVAAWELPAGAPAVFVGVSAPALKRLGGDPLKSLKEQEHVSRSRGADIFLYGQGIHGNLHAVMEFLENSVGWRWYSVYEKPVVPARPSVTLNPFNRRRGFSFPSRELTLYWGPDFYYQNGMNMASEKWGKDPASPFVPYLRNDKFVHSLFTYIPPSPETPYLRRDFTWLPRQDYFATNPDFFSMNATGKRVPTMQLCFGNPALRRELTANVLRHLAAESGNRIITLDANDTPGRLCWCPACVALEQKYQSPGGPLLDYDLELCALLQREHPGVFVRTIAYRRSQTQKPPLLPKGQRLPPNLIISFAPIEDCYFADWTHPDPRLQETYADLKAWNAIAAPGNLWAWLYPNPWGTGIEMPLGNLERNINQVRLMYRAGVRGFFTDHCKYLQRAGLGELQTYLFLKLLQDVNCDTDAIIREFTDHQYGAAAPLARQYLQALEDGRKAMRELPPGVTYTSPNLDDRTFPYLTPDNIHRWQGWFEQMEQRVAADTERLLNVRLLRRELDFATLWKWFDLQKAHPDAYRDAAVVADRITSVNNASAPAGMKHRPLGAETLQDLLAVIAGGGQAKPLPERLAGTPPDTVRQYLPKNYSHKSGRKTVADPQAAFGYAATVDLPDLPFQMGFYQWTAHDPPPGTPSGVHGARVSIPRDQITPGVYRLYQLGEITVTADSWIWFSAQSWGTHLEVGTRVYEPGVDNTWQAWVSLKFDGPSYGGPARDDLVLVDRIILVRQSGQ
ncbi:DUF4838 domain-containing protein [bacterium]|nr:DUF4838 domain-containing protein [bacterium]